MIELTQEIVDELRIRVKKSSEAAVAREIGVSQATVFNWENRVTTNVRGANAQKLCRYLGIDYDEETERQKEKLQAARDASINVAKSIISGSVVGNTPSIGAFAIPLAAAGVVTAEKLKEFRAALANNEKLDDAAKGVVFWLIEKFLS